MSRLASYFRSSADAPPPTDEEIRAARLRAARACPAWEEIPSDLVPRGRRLVSASTDRVYKAVTAGAVFAPGSSSIVAERQPLAYTVDEQGRLTFYEPERRTWSEIVAARLVRRGKGKLQRRKP